jgi:hypothetical protein
MLRRVAITRVVPAWYPAGAAQRHLQNSENRIGPGQTGVQCARQHPCGLEMRAITVVGSTGCFRASGGMADALASGASVLRDVGVQVPLRPHRAVQTHRHEVTNSEEAATFVFGRVCDLSRKISRNRDSDARVPYKRSRSQIGCADSPRPSLCFEHAVERGAAL